jgi:glycosyltransferase involved in cell wall biosynthesis
MAAISFAMKPTRGLVSVIIPTCDKERFIGETLASVGSQTYTNWEVIVVEDASSGGTEQIVRKFSRRHRWHRVDYSRNEEKCGAGQTRNIAFAKARGEFVALLDSDDRWFPDHLAVSVDALRSYNTDIAYSSVLMIEDRTELPLAVWGPTTHELADFPHSMFGRSFVTPSATVMRRKVLEEVGPWDTHLRYCEDYAYWLRCIGANKRFHHVGGCHCLYRKNHDGATTQRLCGTLEEVAQVTEQFMRMPGLRHNTCRRFAARAFVVAAECHATADPRVDPSADRARIGPLLLHAWRLRRKRINYLLKGSMLSIVNWFRPRSRVNSTPRPSAPLVKRAAA